MDTTSRTKNNCEQQENSTLIPQDEIIENEEQIEPLDSILARAEEALADENFGVAKLAYRDAAADYAHDARVWWGLIRCETSNLQNYNINGKAVAKCYENMLAAPQSTEYIEEYKKSYTAYCYKQDKYAELMLENRIYAVEKNMAGNRWGKICLIMAITGCAISIFDIIKNQEMAGFVLLLVCIAMGVLGVAHTKKSKRSKSKLSDIETHILNLQNDLTQLEYMSEDEVIAKYEEEKARRAAEEAQAAPDGE